MATFSAPASMSIKKVKIPKGSNRVYTTCKVSQGYGQWMTEVSKIVPICKIRTNITGFTEAEGDHEQYLTFDTAIRIIS